MFYTPNHWQITMLRNKLSGTTIIYTNSDIYYSRFSVKNEYAMLYSDADSNVISIKSLFFNSYYNIFLSTIQQTATSFIKPHFKKLKFKGKGYYIYKNRRNTVTPQFGYSHRLYMYSYFSSVKFLGKTKILIFGLNPASNMAASFNIKIKRPINIFTGRGVRFARQVVYKKQGKVSSYR